MKFIQVNTVVLMFMLVSNPGVASEKRLDAGSGVRGSSEGGLAACLGPRPQVCAQQYIPVCGKLENGQLHTFASACVACSNAAVEGFYRYACATKLMKACRSPRPEVCSMNYDPVCGQFNSGPSKMFSNACTACEDATVIGYAEGPCP